MSSFPSSQLSGRLDSHDEIHGKYPLRAVGGQLLTSDAGREYVEALVEAGIVCGIGSNRILRYFQLTVDQDEVARLLGKSAGDMRRERGMTPLDLMRRYCADRKTTRALHMTVQHGRRVFHVKLFEHKPNGNLRFARERA